MTIVNFKEIRKSLIKTQIKKCVQKIEDGFNFASIIIHNQKGLVEAFK